VYINNKKQLSAAIGGSISAMPSLPPNESPIQVAVILTDARRRIIWVNDDFTRITGYSLPEVSGRIPGAILQGPRSEPDAVDRIRKSLAREEPCKEEITNYRKNGEPYLCRLVIHPIYDENDVLSNFIAFEVDGSRVPEQEVVPLLQLDEKYKSSSLKGVSELELFERIKKRLEEEELYLDPNLSLGRLANIMDTNTKYLSQVINHCSGKNYQQFINSYRIEAVKEKLLSKEYENLTYFGIAQQCGFKNKSTFYKVFRDFIRATPKDFVSRARRRQRQRTN
jgi:PAS domain S-box-containing protein